MGIDLAFYLWGEEKKRSLNRLSEAGNIYPLFSSSP